MPKHAYCPTCHANWRLPKNDIRRLLPDPIYSCPACSAERFPGTSTTKHHTHISNSPRTET